MKNDILMSLFFLFLIYNVKYVFLFGIGTSHLIVLIMVFAAIFVRIRVSVEHLICTIGVIFLSASSIVVNVFNGFDIIYLRFSVFVLLSLIAANFLIKIFSSNGRAVHDIFKYYGYAAFINAILILLMFLSSWFKTSYLSLIDLEVAEMHGESVFDSMLALRMVGVTGFSAYATAFNQMLCLMLYYIYATHYRPNHKNLVFFDYLIMLSILVSSLIVSRSTVVGMGFLMMLMLLDRRNLARNSLFLFVAALSLVAAFYLLGHFMDDEQFSFFSNWVLEFFNKGLDAGSVESNLAMYKYSWGDFSLLGDARMNDVYGGYYMNTDVGYFRMLFSSGYVGFLFLFFYILVILKPFGIKCKTGTVFAFLILLYVLFFLLKGAIITDSSHIFITLLICSFVLHGQDRVVTGGLR